MTTSIDHHTFDIRFAEKFCCENQISIGDYESFEGLRDGNEPSVMSERVIYI